MRLRVTACRTGPIALERFPVAEAQLIEGRFRTLGSMKMELPEVRAEERTPLVDTLLAGMLHGSHYGSNLICYVLDQGSHRQRHKGYRL